MKHFKKWMALALAGGMTLSVALVGCTEEHTEHIDEDGNGVCDICGEEMPETGGTDEVKITDGAWLDAESMASLKLHEDGSFYMVGVFVNASGSWELTDTATKYYKIESGATPAAEDDQTEYTSEQSIVFTGYTSSGGRFDHTVAFAENTIWNCTIAAGAEMTRTLHQNAEYEWDESAETAIEVARVCMPKDQNANIVLYHDGTFASQLGDYTEGTWTETDAGYAMKDENGADYGVLTAVENGSCTFTPTGGTSVTLYDEVWTPDYTLTASDVSATMKGETESENVTVTLKLWQDSSADIVVMDEGYQTYNVSSGEWNDNGNGTISVTFGEETGTISAPDTEGTISIELTIPAGDIFEQAFTATLTGKSDAKYYSGTAVEKTGFGGNMGIHLVNDGAAQMIALLDGTYTVVGAAGASGISMQATFAYGTYSEDYIFSYTDAEGNARTAEPVLNDQNKLEVTFTNVALSGLPMPGTLTVDVTITLGQTWEFLSVGDYTTTDIEDNYCPSGAFGVDGGYLFMLDGKFELSFHASSSMETYMSAATGTYEEQDDGSIVFTVPATGSVFSSVDGKVDMAVSFANVALNFSFEIENKTLTYASSNGDTPYQTAGTNNATIVGGHLSMQGGTFTVTFDASVGTVVPGNAFCEGTYTVSEEGATTFTVTTAGMEGTFTTDANGTVTFTYENYSIMGMFNAGTVTFVFDIA